MQMSSFLSRSLVSAAASLGEFALSIENSKQMFTERQRKMLRESLMSNVRSFEALCDAHGVELPEDVHHSASVEMKRREHNRAITIQRRQARVLKGESQFVQG
jgi:hypothetical protein